MQLRKTRLLKTASKSRNAKKSYAIKIKVTQSTKKEISSFNTLQQNLFKSIYLIHFDLTRQLYVDLNFSDIDINAMIYHVFINMTIFEETSNYLLKNKIQSIMFLSRLLNEAESRYWSIELEIAKLVWILRKIRHLVKSIKMSTIIYTNHDATLNIAKQISLITFFTNKLNLRLIRVSNYIQRFSLNIRHKSEKFHTVSDALSKLFTNLSTNVSSEQKFDMIHDEELNILYTASTIKINTDFRNRIIQNYKKDFDWIKIANVLNKSNNISFLYVRENDLIYRKEIDTNIAFYVSQKMCAFYEIVKNIFSMIHDVNEHFDFDRTYKQIVFVWYIRDLIKHFTNYFKHCSKCQINQIRRHRSYDSFQLILFSSTSFHTITIDFVLTISFSHIELNNVMSIICKYSKRITIMLDKDIWSAKNWAKALLKRLNIANWEFSKIIISNRNRKFLFDLWTKIFTSLDIKLLYSTAYHSQTDDSFERINQTFKIALKYHIQILQDSKDWSIVISVMQRFFNNSIISIDKSSNEICYDFTSLRSSNLISQNRQIKTNIFKSIQDIITHAQLLFKHIYDQKHQSLQLQVDEWILIRLHKNYNVSSTFILDKKLFQQYAEFFQITERIRNLAYRLAISSNWRIWSVISIAQLKSCSLSNQNSFQRIFASSKIINIKENNETNIRSYEIEKIIVKRITERRNSEYLVRWLKYESKHDVWRNLTKLQDAMNLVREFDASDFALSTRRRKRFKKI